MKTLLNPQTFPSLDKIQIIRSKQNAIKKVMEVILGYGYLDENDKFILVKTDDQVVKHVFVGQDYDDILAAPDPELVIYQKIGIDLE